MFERIKNFIGIEDEYDDEYDYEDETPHAHEEPTVETKATSFGTTEDKYAREFKEERQKRANNVVSMGQPSASSKMKISIQEPLTYDDGPKILDDIMNQKTVVLNLEMLEIDKKRQIFDFVTGGIYALDGKFQKVTKDIFVIVPKGIEIDSKIKETIQAKGFYQL